MIERASPQVGADKLQEMLLARNWSALEDKKVDRRYNKLGKIAQMLMENDGEPPDEVHPAASPAPPHRALAPRPAASAPSFAWRLRRAPASRDARDARAARDRCARRWRSK